MFLIVSVVFLLLFLVVVFMTSGSQGKLLDENIANWASGFENSTVIKLMKYISILGSTSAVLVITTLIGLYFLIKRNWRDLFFFFTVSVGGVILNFALKMLIQRERPGDEVSNIEVFNITFDIQSYSFPSGHTMRATILFLFLMYLAVRYLGNIGVKFIVVDVFVILIILVALSRIFLDAHFATDIIGGIVISVAWFSLIAFLFINPKQRESTMYMNR